VNILIFLTNNVFTGVNTWAYTLAKELSSRGYTVDVEINDEYRKEFLFIDGYDCFIKKLKKVCNTVFIKDFVDYSEYHFSIISNNIHIDKPMSGKKIFVVHGTELPEFDVRNYTVDYKIGTSKTNYEYMKCDKLIHNGIDMEEFSSEKWDLPKVKPKRALLLSRYGLPHHLYYACNTLGIELDSVMFDTNIEEKIGLYDFVISHGRGAYESMACGRPVLVYNSLFKDPNGKTLCDGWIKESNFRKILDRNASGWTFRYDVSTTKRFKEMLSKYDYTDGEKNRRLVRNMLSSKNMCDLFEKVFRELK
tara:strand:+ start:1177 stop:2094 length:918 start_codon:yes stop_codon:yes gene_type:complete